MNDLLTGNRIIEYRAELANTPVSGNPIDEENFYPASGCGCHGADGEYSNALGGLIPSPKEMAKNRAARQQRKQTKADAKMIQSKAQLQAAQGLSQANQHPVYNSPAAMMKPPAKKGMSTGAIIGISVGVLAVLGITAYFFIKHKKGAGKR